MADFDFEDDHSRRRRPANPGMPPVIVLAAWAMIGLFVLALTAGGIWWKRQMDLDALDQKRLDDFSKPLPKLSRYPDPIHPAEKAKPEN